MTNFKWFIYINEFGGIEIQEFEFNPNDYPKTWGDGWRGPFDTPQEALKLHYQNPWWEALQLFYEVLNIEAHDDINNNDVVLMNELYYVGSPARAIKQLLELCPRVENWEGLSEDDLLIREENKNS